MPWLSRAASRSYIAPGMGSRASTPHDEIFPTREPARKNGPVFPAVLLAVPPPYRAYTRPAGSEKRVGTSCRFGSWPLESVQWHSSTVEDTLIGVRAHRDVGRSQDRALIDPLSVFQPTKRRDPTRTAVESWYHTGCVGWPSDAAVITLGVDTAPGRDGPPESVAKAMVW